MAILNFVPVEYFQAFLYFLLFLGVALMLEPLCEIFYFKKVTSQMCPKNRPINGQERYLITKEIKERFYSRPFSLMSKPRKFLRKFLWSIGIALILSWLVLHALL
ncbi:MAG: hypothetical protein NC453_17625 [Muribaculum sp.]|nr:hypothetical protein [Muribaculum sp.]